MRRAALVVVAAGMCVSAARAQDIMWNNPAGGVWSNAGNWSPANVPDTNAERAVISLAGGYVVSVDSTFGIGGLTLTGAKAQLNVLNSRALVLRGDTLNDRVILVNPSAGGSGTIFQVEADAHLGGSGVLRLNANGANVATGVLRSFGAGNVIRQDTGHSVRGTGQITGAFVNDGEVNADVSTRVLEVQASVTNRGPMLATGGGVLRVAGSSVGQAGPGEIRSEGAGSVVQINASSIDTGSVSGVLGGIVSAASSSSFTSVHTDGQIEVPNGSALILRGTGLTNDGTLTVNPSSGSSGTILQMETDGVLGGSGEVVLRANAANPDTAVVRSFGAGNVVHQAPTHRVRGAGSITGAFVNEGLVRADGSSPLGVVASVGNTGTMDAQSGSTLRITVSSVTQSVDGVVRADAGTVQVEASSVTGGLVEAVNGGIVRVVGGTTVFTDVRMGGPAEIVNNNALVVRGGGLENAGVIRVNPSAGSSGTILQFETDGLLTGGGEVVLNASAANLDTAVLRSFGAGNVVRHRAGHTVRGKGRITGVLISDGLVSADTVPGIDVAASVTNSAIMRGVGGATLSFTSGALNQVGAGRVSADGGFVSMASASITGGLVEGVNGGIVRNAAGATVFTDVHTAGAVHINNATAIVVRGTGLVNDGTISVNPQNGASGTILQFETDGQLGGSGTVALGANVANLDTAVLRSFGAGNVVRQGTAHRIRGNGRITGVFVNAGNVTADVVGSGIDLAASITNSGVMRASPGAFLSVSGSTVVQSGAGAIDAGGGSALFNSASLTGGLVAATGGGVSRVNSGASVFSDVRVQGSFEIANAQALVVRGSGLVNDGVVTVNPSAGASGTILQFETNGTLGGTGAVILNANPANFDTAILRAFGAGNGVTNGAGHTVGGRGRVGVPFTNAGRVAPGAQEGGTARLEVTGAWSNTPTAEIAIDIGGNGQGSTYDLLQSQGAVTLDGTLRVRLVNAFIPARGATFDVITAPSISGTFDTVILPELPLDYGYARIEYTPTSVRVHIPACRADWNGIGGGNSQDFFDFLSDFFGGTADYNRDGFSNSQDFFDFLTDFFRPCVG